MLWRRNYNVTLATKTTTLQRRHDVACLLGLSKMLHSPSLFVLDSADLMLSKKRLRSDHWFQSQTDIYWIICVSDSTYFHSRIRSIVLTTWYPKYAHLSQNSLLFVAFVILNFGKIDRSTNSFQNWITARFAYIDYFNHVKFIAFQNVSLIVPSSSTKSGISVYQICKLPSQDELHLYYS